MLIIFSTPELIRNLWQLKTAVFLHWCLLHAVPLARELRIKRLWFLWTVKVAVEVLVKQGALQKRNADLLIMKVVL